MGLLIPGSWVRAPRWAVNLRHLSNMLSVLTIPKNWPQSQDSCLTSLVAQTVKRLPTTWETRVQSLGWEDTLEKEMATHSSVLAWKIPWTEEPGRLQSTVLQRVGHDWVTSLSLFTKTSCSICLFISGLLHLAKLLPVHLCNFKWQY